MRFWLKIILFFCVILFLSCFLAPLVKLSFDLLVIIFPSLKSVYSFELTRILNRLVMLFAVAGMFVFYKELGFKAVKELGINFNKGWFVLFAKGFFLGGLSLFILVFILIEFGLYRVVLRSTLPEIIISFFKYGLAALLIGVIEELFFRGVVLQTLIEKKSLWFSLFTTNVFYSLVHFFRGENLKVADKFDIWSGFIIVKAMFLNLGGDFKLMLPTFIGLFLLGLTLSYAYLRTGSLFLSIGLHAGWVFFIKSDGFFIDNTAKTFPKWLFDSRQVISGVLSWFLVGLVFVAIYFLTKKKEKVA